MVPNAGDSLSDASGERLLGSFVIPCFREEATVARTIAALDELARSKPELDWEIIVIDDGSDDDTAGEAAGGVQHRDAGPAVAPPAQRRPGRGHADGHPGVSGRQTS